MAFILADRVQQTGTANTTVSFTLSGSVAGYQSFAVIGDTNTTYYGATDGTNWEVGLGTYSTTGPTLTRTTILSSSNSGSAVTFSGAINVWVDYPAGKQVSSDYPNALGVLTPAAGTFTTLTGQTEVLKGTGQNLLPYSNTFSSWTASSGTTVTTGQTDPFGGTTASYYTPTSQYGNIGDAVTLSAGVPYTFSIWSYVASGTRTISLYTNAGVSLGSFTATTTWTRYSINFTPAAGGAVSLQLQDRNATGFPINIFVYGAQLEIGSVTNTYVPTTTTAVYGTPTLSFSGVAGLGLQSDGSLYVQPAGTGALQAQATTSTATGGSARGANAVDWQTLRGNANQVASGAQAVVSGGFNNRASGAVSAVVGGDDNTASGVNAVVAGGAYHTASGLSSYIGGGVANTASNSYTFIGSGNSNTAAGYYNFIGGGFTNSGNASAAVTTQATTIAVSAGTTFYLTATNANIKVGQYITGTGISGNTYATSTVTTGTAAVMATSSISGTTLTVGSVSSGTIIAGQILTGTGVTAGTYIVSGSGLSWTVSVSQTVSSTTITGTAYTFTISQAATTTAGITLSFYTPHGIVVGGGNNIASGSYSFIGGGGDAGTSVQRNNAVGDWSVIVGGSANSSNANYGMILGGQSNGINAGATWSSVIGGANCSIGTNSSSGIVGGNACSIPANASNAIAIGGRQNTATATTSSVFGGNRGTTRAIVGNTVFPANWIPIADVSGITQTALLVIAKQTTDATATVLTSDGGAGSTTNQVIMPNNSAYYFKVRVIAGVTGAGDTKAWTLEGAIKRGANAAATSIVGTVTTTVVAADVGAATWTVTATADTTNGGLAITATGAAATTIRWVAKAETAEMTY